eukprot:3546919-Rhodomonas_salina.1
MEKQLGYPHLPSHQQQLLPPHDLGAADAVGLACAAQEREPRGAQLPVRDAALAHGLHPLQRGCLAARLGCRGQGLPPVSSPPA